ncbi:hypothetical protein PXC01_18320 [Maribacter sp. M208]|uniref:hypothetical protein n=1 Tax=Maribacter huludaoensis TaxID=3030010 RepID=UPI0023EC4244|nr:hypothetical protein [Maribacter huludaoensis]MDF4223558.1 hypothetical protein [Maribacter huludaoensis]
MGLVARFTYFYDVRKIFGILLWTGKNKSKQKDFAMCVAESKRQFAPVLFIAKPLGAIQKNE